MNTHKPVLSLNLEVLVNTYAEPAWLLDDMGRVLVMNTLASTCYCADEDRGVLPVKGCLKSAEGAGAHFQMHYHTLNPSPACYLVRLLPVSSSLPTPMSGESPAPSPVQRVDTDSREDLLKKFIQFIPNPVFVKDRQHRWILLNRAFADFLGKSPEELLFKTDYDFFPKAEADVFWQKDEEVFLTGKLNENEEAFTDVHGNTRWILTRKVAFLNESNETILLGVITDITQQRTMARRLDQARRQAEQANQVKSEFLARMSHELRTPLNAVIGFSQVVKKSAKHLNADEAHYLDRIRSNGFYLLDLINDLLDLSVIESGQVELQKSPCDVDTLLQDLRDVFAPLAEQKGVRFVMKTEPLSLDTDPTRLRQVVSNLLQNAVKFTTSGEINLELNAEPSPCIIVEDSGPGVPLHLKERIFQEFVQAKEVMASSQGGVGLGLAISKHLSAALGFRLELDETSTGARFILYLAP